MSNSKTAAPASADAGNERGNVEQLGERLNATDIQTSDRSQDTVEAEFDYGDLSKADAADLRKSAARIRNRAKSFVQSIIETGRDLIAAKEKLEHKLFTPWVEKELGLHIRSAQRFMAAAQWAEDKSDTVSLLSPSTIYLLAAKSAPQDAVNAIVAKAEAGELVPESVAKKMLDDAVEHRRQAEIKSQRKQPSMSKAAVQRREKLQKKEEAEKQKRVEEAEAIAQELIEEVGATAVRRVLYATETGDHSYLVHTALLDLVHTALRDAIKAVDTEPPNTPMPAFLIKDPEARTKAGDEELEDLQGRYSVLIPEARRKFLDYVIAGDTVFVAEVAIARLPDHISRELAERILRTPPDAEAAA